MSHAPQRKEKDCLNCGSIVQGKYCQNCGQENIVPKETFFSMVAHFFNDITHFDGKFFSSLRDLVFRPGFLSAEYIRGRRARYLHPIRMYVFTSALFFLIFFSVRSSDSIINTSGTTPISPSERATIQAELEDSLALDPNNRNLQAQLDVLSDSGRVVYPADLIIYSGDFNVVGTIGGDYKTMEQYDSVQASRPASKRDGWLKKRWNHKAIELNSRYKSDRKESIKKVTESITHKLPYLLFVSLPFFALILKLLYLRRKNYYYADHGIFSVHHYIFSFLLLLLVFIWDELKDVNGWQLWNILIFITLIAWPVYLFIAMKRFYGQGFFKTFLKFILLNIIGLIILILLLMGFFILSIFQL